MTPTYTLTDYQQIWDFSPKSLHFIFNQELGEGLIFDPVKINQSEADEKYLATFLSQGNVFALFIISTEMGPGEMATTLKKSYNAEVPVFKGGIRALVKLTAENFAEFSKIFKKFPNFFFVSKEKEMFRN